MYKTYKSFKMKEFPNKTSEDVGKQFK